MAAAAGTCKTKPAALFLPPLLFRPNQRSLPRGMRFNLEARNSQGRIMFKEKTVTCLSTIKRPKPVPFD